MNQLLALAFLLASGSVVVGAQPRMLNVGDASLRFESAGTGQAIIFIHGWAQDLRLWDAEVPVFSSTYRVIRYDRRGYGKSTGHADPSADPADLLALLDSLGIERPHLVGLSGGAGVALRFAMAYPDRVHGLVLCGYGGAALQGLALPAGTGGVPPYADILRRYGKDSLTKFVFSSPLVWRPPGSPDPLLDQPQWWKEYDGRDLLDPRPQSGRVPPPQWRDVPGLRVPTLVINGEHDIPRALAVADSLAARLPDVRRVVIPDAGHGVHIHQPAVFHRTVMEFLRALDARRGAG
ncbi:MAG TPA: alpha/beta hydrolase [Gemmatimonadaceae bacterium]